MTDRRPLTLLLVVWIVLSALGWIRAETVRRRIDDLERSQIELQVLLEQVLDEQTARARVEARLWRVAESNHRLLADRAGQEELDDLAHRIATLEKRLEALEER